MSDAHTFFHMHKRETLNIGEPECKADWLEKPDMHVGGTSQSQQENENVWRSWQFFQSNGVLAILLSRLWMRLAMYNSLPVDHNNQKYNEAKQSESWHHHQGHNPHHPAHSWMRSSRYVEQDGPVWNMTHKCIIRFWEGSSLILQKRINTFSL